MIATYLYHRAAFGEAMDPRFYTLNWLDEQVATGRFCVWGNLSAAIIAKLEDYPSGAKMVEGVYAVGNVPDIKLLIPLAEQWGRENGASFGSISSREAWEKLMPDYTAYKVTIIKDLRDG